MNSVTKSTTRILIKLVVAITLISWFLYISDVNKIFQSILNVSTLVFGISLILTILCLLVNTLKWKLLLPYYPSLLLLKLIFISYYYSLILPGQMAGEVAKALLLGNSKNNISQITVSVVIDKLTGIIGLLLVGIFGLLFTHVHIANSIIIGLTSICIAGILFLFALRWSPVYYFIVKITNTIRTNSSFGKNVLETAKNIIYCWNKYTKETNKLLLSILLGMMYQVCSIIMFIFLSKTLGINISFIDWCWILAILSIALFLPVTIGGIGIREGTLIGALSSLGVSSEKALALSFLIFGLQIILAIVGVIFHFTKTRKDPIHALNTL